MNRHYYRQFYECKPLDLETYKPCKVGDLVNPNNKHVLNQVEIDFYNQLSTEINKATYRADQEWLLDRRALHFSSSGVEL